MSMNERAAEYCTIGQHHLKRVRRDDNEVAVALFNKALELDPDCAVAHAGICGAYSQKVGLLGFPRGWLDLAIPAGQRAIDLDPDLVDGYSHLAVIYAHKGWLKKALAIAEQRAELVPDHYQNSSMGNVGWLRWYMGRPDIALPLREVWLAECPDVAWAHFHAGNATLALGRYADAEKNYGRCVEIQGNQSSGHIGLISTLIAQGKRSEGTEQLHRFRTETPDDGRFDVKCADAAVLVGLDEIAKMHAIKAVDEAPDVRYMPRGTLPTTILGYLLAREDKANQVEELFSRSAALNQERLDEGDEGFQAPYDLAIVECCRGNLDDAVARLRAAFEAGWLYPDLAQHDPMLSPLAKHEGFRQLLDEVRKRLKELNDSR